MKRTLAIASVAIVVCWCLSEIYAPSSLTCNTPPDAPPKLPPGMRIEDERTIWLPDPPLYGKYRYEYYARMRANLAQAEEFCNVNRIESERSALPHFAEVSIEWWKIPVGRSMVSEFSRGEITPQKDSRWSMPKTLAVQLHSGFLYFLHTDYAKRENPGQWSNLDKSCMEFPWKK